MSRGPAIALSGLWREYGDRVALRDVSLDLPRGATLAVFGPNGAGKTTLLRVLATLLRPTAGQVSVLGCALPGEAWRLRGRIGFLGHEPLLYRDLTARENLRFGARLFDLPISDDERVDELLGRAGLERHAERRVAELSAGMVQRLSICRAVLHRPELLLLDEPRSHLDPDAAVRVAPLVGPAEGRTRVLVTHDVAGALGEADRVLALRGDGAVAYEGPAAAIDTEALAALYARRTETSPVASAEPAGSAASAAEPLRGALR